MPESPKTPENPTLETVQQTTETLAKFVQWIAELIRRRNWFTLLLLINVVLILFCTPGGIVPQFLKSAFSFQLLEFYSSIFWVVVGVIFLAAIAVAVITMPPISKDKAQTPVKRQAIKGLLSFTATDAEIFSPLERNQDIKRSKRRIYRNFGIVGSIVVSVIGIWGWLNYTTLGQLTQIRWKLTDVSQQISDPKYEAQAVAAFAKAQNVQQALKAANSIEDSSDKANALSAIAEAIGNLNQLPEAQKLLGQVLKAAESIEDSSDKAIPLNAIAVAYGNLKQLPDAQKLLGQVLKAAESIEDSSDKADALSAIAVAYGKLNQLPEAQKLLGQALMAAESIEDSSSKANALSAIAQAIGKLKQLPEAQKLLQQALKATESIESSSSKAYALIAIAEAEANLKNWGQALKVTQKCPSEDCKVESLAKVLTVYAEQQHPELKEEEKEE